MSRGGTGSDVRRSQIVDTSVLVLFHSIAVLSLYFLFAGHNQPGGGFVGGLVLGAAISLRYVAGGMAEVRNVLPLSPWTILATGLATSAVTAIVPVLLGHDVLEHDDVTLHPPLLGTVKFTTALPFDIGVYLVVVGMVLMIFEAFGDDLPEEPTELEGDAS